MSFKRVPFREIYPTDEMRVNFKFLKFAVDRVFKLFAAFNTVTALLEQYECI